MSVTISIPLKLLQLADRPHAGPSSFEGIIGTEIDAHVSMLYGQSVVMLHVINSEKNISLPISSWL